jgi:multicomponent Na+:H+ antiporter subunit D
MLAHLPVLQVIVPLIAAPLCVLLRHGRAAWALATLATWSAFAVAVLLLLQVLETGTVRYLLGGWLAPWGIEYVVDQLNAYILVIVSGIGAVVMPYALKSVDREIDERRHYLFYTLYLLALAGLLGIAITGDAFNIFVFLEISSLSSYALISLGRNRKALHAAYQYLIMGTIGATFYLIGVGLLYMMTGTLNIADLAQRIAPISDSRVVLTAFAFIVVGVSLKLALFPLHLWLPNAYAFAPSVVTVFLAGTATKVSLYVLLRVIFTIFGANLVFGQLRIGLAFLVLGVAGIVICSLVAIYQRNVKRLLAFSSVAQIGYMILGVSLGTVLGLQAGLLHVFNHAIIKAGLFMAVGCIVYRIGSARIADMKGIGRQMPWTMAAFVVCGLGLIGVPFTAGFVSKWYLILATLERGWWPVAALIVLTSILALIYVWRVVEVAYFQRPEARPPSLPPIREAPSWMLVPTWILALATIYFGLETTASVDVAGAAARALMGSGG